MAARAAHTKAGVTRSRTGAGSHPARRRQPPRFPGDRFPVDFLAVDRLPADFRADVRPADFVAVDFRAVDRLVVDRFAVERSAVERFAVERLAAPFFAAPRFAVDLRAVDFLAAPRFAAPRLAAPRLVVAAERSDGTLAPRSRASESAMAMACSRLVTVPPRPPRPRFSVPFFSRRSAVSTDLLAAAPYFRAPPFRPRFVAAMNPPTLGFIGRNSRRMTHRQSWDHDEIRHGACERRM
jgi:hypothetical protein